MGRWRLRSTKSTPPIPIGVPWGCLGFGIREPVEPMKSAVEQADADVRLDPSCLGGRRRSALPDDRTQAGAQAGLQEGFVTDL